MPRKLEMKFDRKAHRWRRMIAGERYEVYCHQFAGLPKDEWTEQGSYKLANDWLEAERIRRGGAAHPHAQTIRTLEERADYAKAESLPELATIEAETVRVRSARSTETVPTTRAEKLAQLQALQAELGIYVPTFAIPAEPPAANPLDMDDPVWQDRTRRTRRTPKNQTMEALAEAYIAPKLQEAREGSRGADSADGIRRHVGHFVEFVGGTSPVSCINADQWERWNAHCETLAAKRIKQGKPHGISIPTRDKWLTDVRAFVKWLYMKDHLETLPKNLTAKLVRLQEGKKRPSKFTNEEIAKLFASTSNGKHLCMMLLMLNCGMTQKDVSDLRKDQIDFDLGRITRIRSKMQNREAGRIVSYKLWPITLKLLKQHCETKGEIALLCDSGSRWVWNRIADDGRREGSDNATTVFNNIKKRAGIVENGKSLKVFRKTSATRIKSNPIYAGLRFLFLGHADNTVADINYADDIDDTLDACIDWLATQYPLPK